jgi:hypothetical protein
VETGRRPFALIDRGFYTMIGKSMKRLVPVLILAALPAWGGTVSFSFNQHSTRNIFQTSDALSDRISAFTLALDQDLGALSILGQAEYSAFAEATGMNFFAANMGLDYLVPAGRKGAFYFAAGGTGQFYRQSYAAFSSLGAHLVGAFKTYLAPSSIMKVQWQGQYASYNDSLFDALSQSLSLSIDKYFPSRTTLKAEAGWGYKYFLHPFLPEAAETVPAAALLSSGGPGGPGFASGQGNGGGGDGGWGGQQYQGGYGFVPRTSGTGGGAGIGNVSVSLLAAQGLGDAVGLSVSALRQWIVSGENPFLSIEEFYYVQNPTSDSFSWEGTQVSGRITLELPWDLSLKTGYVFSDRSYPGVESLSADGLPLGLVRSDRQHLVEARLQKDFRALSVFVAYAHIDNTSTDPLFVWKSPFLTAGIEWRLPTARKRGAS